MTGALVIAGAIIGAMTIAGVGVLIVLRLLAWTVERRHE